MAFGDRLKKLRKERGITQQELGEIIHISDRVIGYYEANNRFPKDEKVLIAIADYFNVSIDYMVGHDYSVKNGYLPVQGLPLEAVKQVEEYIELIRLKYKVRKPNSARE
ncbi:helix-turn-helix domain-containing protein [Ruminiclostridium josui]|uniref:helix-turn-helix domain-containing protein n=1 Tax=Ruminiclostridium josui TaxID=1499 RepID=UPI000467CADC|nr:helix-turn-helix transcriptional regulator [Ruminiclostridium josui]